MKLSALTGLVLSFGLLLTGCSSNDPVVEESQPTIAPAVEVKNIDDLRSAFERAGGSCLEWKQDNAVSEALQSGNCDSRTVLMFFADRETAADRALALKNLSKQFDKTPNLLLGDNWLINSPQVRTVSESLDGVLIVD